MKKPFTKEEVIVSDLLVKAHNAFIKLPKGHPSDINEWVISIHRMQNILMSRVVARDYKEIFAQSEKPKKFDKNEVVAELEKRYPEYKIERDGINRYTLTPKEITP